MSSRDIPVTPLELATVHAIVGLRLGDARRLPDLAAEYVAFGMESSALVELAGLDLGQPVDSSDARDLYAGFLADVGQPTTSDLRTQAGLASAFLARRMLEQLDQPRHACRRFSALAVELGYEWPLDEIGELYGIDDKWRGGWGRTPEELEGATDRVCKALLAKVETEWGVLDSAAVTRINGLF